jgi:hypothetical protein
MWSCDLDVDNVSYWFNCSYMCNCDSHILRPTLDKGRGSNFLGTNLDWFEANWILELDYTLVPSLISKLGALLLALFYWSEPIDFPSKTSAM